MDDATAKLILKGLLERLTADYQSQSPQFTTVFSQTDRAALEQLIGTEKAVSPPIKPEASVFDPGRTGGIPDSPSEQVETPGQVHFLEDATYPELNFACLDSTSADLEYTICIDFGTAKSKAFACKRGTDEPVPADLKELGIGDIDGDLDGSKYSVASSVWISDDGLVFAGSHAMRRSSEFGVAANRQRIDSIKQELSLVS